MQKTRNKCSGITSGKKYMMKNGEKMMRMTKSLIVVFILFNVIQTTSANNNSTTFSATTDTGIEKWTFFEPMTGDGYLSGYIAVKYNGEWGTVMDDTSFSTGIYFKDNAADVLCKANGYVGGVYDEGIYKSTGGVVDGKNRTSLRVLINRVTCEENGDSLDNCTFSIWPPDNWQHYHMNVGIKCYTKPVSNTIELGFFQPTITDHSIHGYIAIKYHAEWGTICQFGGVGVYTGLFDNPAADALCKMAGYESGLYDGGMYNTGSGLIDGKNRTSLRHWLLWLSCDKGESFDDCDKAGWGKSHCDHTLDVGLKCYNTSSPPPNKVKLGFFNPLKFNDFVYGYIALQYNGVWGTICEYGFTDKDANVICKEAGYLGGVYGNGIYNVGDGLIDGSISRTSLPFKMIGVRCVGNEASIDDCPYLSDKGKWGSGCAKDDVGLKCYNTTAPISTKLKFLEPVKTDDYIYGYIAVQHSGVWGTVCKNNFDDHAAAVLCREAGYKGGYYATNGDYKTGTGGPITMTILLDDVRCHGNESSIDECSHAPWGVHNCQHKDDVGVKCVNTSDADTIEWKFFQPITEDGYVSGYIAVKYQAEWGVVNDKNFKDKDADVLCKSNGYVDGGVFDDGIYTSHGGVINGKNRTSLRIWFDRLTCIENGTSIDNCTFSIWPRSSEQDHSTDVGIKCYTKPVSQGLELGFFQPTTTDYSIHGYIAIKYHAEWGNVCPDKSGWGKFDDNAADALCKMGGYESGVYDSGMYNTGDGLIDGKNRTSLRYWLLWLDCNKGDTFDQCAKSFARRGESCEYPNEYVGLRCYKPTWISPVKIEKETNITQGKLLATFEKLTKEFDVKLEVKVVSKCTVPFCNIFDFKLGDTFFKLYTENSGDKLMLNTSLVNSRNGRTRFTVDANLTIGVWNHIRIFQRGKSFRMFSDEDDTLATNRLPQDFYNVNIYLSSPGEEPLEGVVRNFIIETYDECRKLFYDMQHNGQFQLMCEDCRESWTDTYVTKCVAEWRTEAEFIKSKMIACDRACSTKLECYKLKIAKVCKNCGDKEKLLQEEDVKLCSEKWDRIGEKKFFDCETDCVKLDFYTRHENNEFIYGYIALKYNGVWGTVCKDSFDDHDANVICKEAGYLGGVYGDGIYNVGEGMLNGTNRTDHGIILSDIHCSGNEVSIHDCLHGGWGNNTCKHEKDVGLKCYKTTNITSSTMRLFKMKPTGGSVQGHVSIKYQAEWGRICKKGFDEKDADVLCRMGDFNGGYYDNGIYGGKRTSTTLRIWTEDVQCHGNESSIYDCPNGGWGKTNCSFYDDVGIKCYVATPRADTQVRFFDPSSDGKYVYGRIAINYHDEWGTVSNTDITDHDAHVLCKMFPYDEYVGGHFDKNIYATGDGSMDGYERTSMRQWLDKIGCNGSESNIDDCAHSVWGIIPVSNDDIGIKCYKDSVPDDSVKLQFFKPQIKDGLIEGRIAIKYHGEWGTICNRAFGDEDANVLCKEAGYSGGVYDSGAYSTGGDESIDGVKRTDMRIWLANMNCQGNEDSIHNCTRSEWGEKVFGCVHAKDVGIKCEGNTCERWGMSCGDHGKCTPLTTTTYSCACNDDYLEENGKCVKDEKLALKIALPIVLIILLIIFITVVVCKCKKEGRGSPSSASTQFENKAYTSH